MVIEQESQLEYLLSEFSESIRNVPFEVFIYRLYGVYVKAFNLDYPENKRNLVTIGRAMRETCLNVQDDPIKRSRPNEVGNDMEHFVIKALEREGLQARRPETKSGHGKSTGYPDICIETGGMPIYLEVKTYAAANKNTTQRSFYFSPSKDPKVIFDAHHLAVGFEVKRQENGFIPIAWKIIDLFGLKCDMKLEFNSDNRRLYDKDHVLDGGNVLQID